MNCYEVPKFLIGKSTICLQLKMCIIPLKIQRCWSAASLILKSDLKVSIFQSITLTGKCSLSKTNQTTAPPSTIACCSFCLFPSKYRDIHHECGKSFQRKGFGPRHSILPSRLSNWLLNRSYGKDPKLSCKTVPNVSISYSFCQKQTTTLPSSTILEVRTKNIPLEYGICKYFL